LLVVSAHAADFVWRAGGIIASYATRGGRARVLCLSYGERGESAKLWRQPGMTLEKVKQDRHREADNAAATPANAAIARAATAAPLPRAAAAAAVSGVT